MTLSGPWKVVAVNPHPEEMLQYEHEALGPLGVTMERLYASDDDAILAGVADADVVVPMAARMSARVIENLTRCRLIPSGGIGFDHIDVVAATKKGILVTNMADTFVEEVANHAWMLILMVARRGLWLHETGTTNRWQEAHGNLWPILRIHMPRITGQTLGLVSFGRIARAAAARGRGFGMECIAYDPYVKSDVFREHGVEQVSLDDLFRRADVISCHLPLSNETYHLVGEAQFKLMKPTAIFVNTGRGKVVDEAALIAALREGRILGAGLDVFEQEPPDQANPLLRMPNVTVSPHLASISDVSHVERHRLAGRQIADALRGKVPKGVVNGDVLERWRGRFQVS